MNTAAASKCSRIDEIMTMVRECDDVTFDGTELERQELSELKMQLSSWQKLCEDLLEGKNWPFPCVERMLNASEYKLREWRRRFCGIERDVDRELLMHSEDQRLAREQVYFTRPDQETFDRVVEVMVGMRNIWIVVCIKFVRAVAAKVSDVNERKKRCRGVVDFA